MPGMNKYSDSSTFSVPRMSSTFPLELSSSWLLEDTTECRRRSSGSAANVETAGDEVGKVDADTVVSGRVSIGDLDTITGDADWSDTGRVDSAVVDTGVADTAVVDTDVMESGVSDTAVLDAAALDAAVLDAAVLDSAVLDATAMDTGLVDTGEDILGKDTGRVATIGLDSGLVNAGRVDTDGMQSGVGGAVLLDSVEASTEGVTTLERDRSRVGN